MEEKIELTDLELAMLKRELRGEFFAPEQTKEECLALHDVIEKAEKYMDQLNAYEESGSSLLVWYYNKYRKQEGIPGPDVIYQWGGCLNVD
ncbi:MAG: hypothetical protein HDS50_01070 [Bacteroides sp.]|nr:hypothetical protein [Bacteroides sp.]